MFANTPLITTLAESEQLSWDMAKQIIQSQSNLAMIGITVLVGLAVVLLAFSWIWHFRLHKSELERAVESLKSEITTKVEEDFTKLTKGLDDKAGKTREEIEKSIAQRMRLFDAEKARIFAFANMQLKEWETGVGWWTEAIEGYAEARREDGLRIAVDGLRDTLEFCEKLEDDKREGIKKCLPLIPAILRTEKKQIEDRLNKLPKEISKQSETS